MRRALPFALVAGLSALPAHAETLWQDLAAGMTRQELMASHPAATPDAADTLWGRKTTELDEAAAFTFEGLTFDANYSFLDAGLVRIILTTPAERTTLKNLALFDRLRTSLSDRFGPPVTPEHNIDEMGTAEAIWQNGPIELHLLYIDLIKMINIAAFAPRPAG